jgi:hypothetical protein
LNTGAAVFSGKFGTDVLTVATSAGSFVDKNAGVGKTVNISTLSLGGADAGNYTLASTTASTTADITPASISSISGITAANKVYDGNTNATLGAGSAVFNGRLGSDVLTVGSGSGNFIDRTAGLGKAVNIAGLGLGGADALNYTLGNATASALADITPATITLSGITAANKVYDGTTSATVNTGAITLGGRVGLDDVSVNGAGAGSFADKNAALAKTVTITGLSLTGADAANYTLSGGSALATADITPASIGSITGITANNKTYDGNTSAVLDTSSAGFTGRIGADQLTVASATGNFNTKNAASGKTVNITGLALGGLDSVNYTLGNTTASATADIFTATISAISGVTAANKVYDANTSVTLNAAGAILSGKVAGDTLTVGPGLVGSFSDKNAALGKTVTIGGVTLAGADAANYTLGSLAVSAIADITPAILTVSGITAANKEYDATTAATLSGSATVTALGGDIVGVGGAGVGTFNSKDVGNARPVTVSGYTLAGTDAGNYVVLQPTGVAADITPRLLSASLSPQTKVYDGTTALSAALSITGLVGTETVTATGAANFNSKDVLTANLVTVAGVTLADGGNGGLASNYSLSGGQTATGTITPKALTVAYTGVDKVYDGNSSANATPNLGGVVGSDAVSVSQTVTSTAKDVGVRTIVVSGVGLQGVDAPNYSLGTTAATATAAITQLQSVAWTGGGGASNRLWSSAANWAGGAVPDHDNVALATIPAGAGSVQLDSPIRNMTINSASPIVQSGGSVAAGALSFTTGAGISLGNSNNAMTSLTVSNTGPGDVSIVNNSSTVPGALNVVLLTNTGGSIDLTNYGAITTTGLVKASIGSAALTANSPLTIGAPGIEAGGDITLIASNLTSAGNMTLNGKVDAGGAVLLDAGGTLTQNGAVVGLSGVTARAGVGPMVFGPFATTNGSPISYTVNGVAVTAPPTLLFSQTQQADTVTAFLQLFEAALAQQDSFDVFETNPDGTTRRKNKTDDTIVTEGEVCK